MNIKSANYTLNRNANIEAIDNDGDTPYVDNDRLKELKIAYNIITESQDIIPLKRRGIPMLDIIRFVKSYNIMEWYYDINPKAFTKHKINKLLEDVKIMNHEQLSKFEKFFESINI